MLFDISGYCSLLLHQPDAMPVSVTVNSRNKVKRGTQKHDWNSIILSLNHFNVTNIDLVLNWEINRAYKQNTVVQ